MRILNLVCDLAFEAGAHILNIYNSKKFYSSDKKGGSPITIADLIADQIITDGLKKITPDTLVLSEESFESRYYDKQEKFWLVDPLDGTKDFLAKTAEFTVNISLIERGKPVLGVVYAPALKTIYFAKKGRGAFKQNAGCCPIRILSVSAKNEEKIKFVGSRFHGTNDEDSLMNYLGLNERLVVGSSLKFCLVAEGSAHVYPRTGPTMYWDTAAAHCIVNEAGGVVCDFFGNELEYNSANFKNPPFIAMSAKNDFLINKIFTWKKQIE